MANIQNTDNIKCSEDMEQQKLKFIAGGNANAAVTLEDSVSVSCKAKYSLATELAIFGIWPNELKIYDHIGNLKIISGLFIIAGTWKQSRCPLIGGWLNIL